jgi:hypothetical protein
VTKSDNWDFPTNQYPTVGLIGRVHRGTPWQTVYLKSRNVLNDNQSNIYPNRGMNTWTAWTGNFNSYDAANSAPLQDRLLFDIFTTRFNDNAVRGTLPVNTGADLPDGGLAAWSAVFSGMVALSNNLPTLTLLANTPVSVTNLIINPAGVNTANSPLAQLVNSITATRSNKGLFPQGAFTHVGDILQTPALSEQSPFLNLVGKQTTNGINDELYEWLPQQMMGLVRASTAPRYVIYAYGQTLKPAPNGKVLSGPFFQLITNYQIVAESATRAVVQVHPQITLTSSGLQTNYSATVEISTVLPPSQ